ncbi:ABC transporter permease [Planomonospora venezuelensis]|uniref:Glycine betaine/proline transport system permease protein n=1 Tax=Planomonospora venezuelensis TaxID=1999 RepID=A0A841DBJ2_PLAVE|nr:ABC transporter permease subunit [Planomonospora venezuelensis]MBB5965824.1 glycine betaine/proline transport system permease protein [Planomonospora venezuelensis]GIN04018.1 glycine/betaine ABC transporter permease [Planomonospora venezuelensis]
MTSHAPPAPPVQASPPPLPRRAVRLPPWAPLLAGAAAATAAYLAFRGTATLPHDPEAAPFRIIGDVRAWADANRNQSPVFLFFVNYVRLFVGGLYDVLLTVLTAPGWAGLSGIATGIGLLAGGWRTGLLTALGFGSFGVLGVWEASVTTLALVLTAVLLSLAAGLPLGILAGHSARLRRLLDPVLDVMQIMPTFAYLAPMVLFFQIGPASAAVATMIYSVPPAIRITALAIRQVSPSAVEASVSLGATRGQTLRKVELPMARATIGLAVNQTIMMALSMVVIAALIAAPGLGSDIIRGLTRADVGVMLPAGLAIVVMAIVLDRVTSSAAARPPYGAARPGKARALSASRLRWLCAAAVALGGPALGRALPEEFPAGLVLRLAGPVNEAVDAVTFSWYDLTEAVRNLTTEALLNPLQTVLTSAPWWLVAAVVLAVAWRTGGPRPAAVAVGCLLATALIGLWQHTMETLTTVLVAVALTLLAGVLLGIAAARSPRFAAVQRPLLDAAQTMPAFVYLLPALALFGATRFTAVFASVIYAVPPVIRLVEDGVRNVSPAAVEAALSCGSTGWQLLWKVRLPMARRAILLAANQGIVMTLAMVVVGGLVGAGGLGYDVVSGFSQRADFGMGFAAGVATVLLGIMLDRITQGAGARPSPRTTTGKKRIA